MTEMAKDKPVLRNVEANSNSFAKTLEGVETGLLVQINYLTTVSTSELLTISYSSFIFQRNCQFFGNISEMCELNLKIFQQKTSTCHKRKIRPSYK